MYWRSGSNQLRRRTTRICSLILAILLISYLVSRSYILTGGVLAVVTYGTFFFLAVVPVECLADKKLLEDMSGLIRKVLLLEAIVGIVQGLAAAYQSGSFDAANGDAVEGTIHLSFTPDDAFGNPMFAANLCFMLLALLPGLVAKRRSLYLPVVLGIIAFVLASVMHTIIFLAVSIVLALCLFRPPIPAAIGKSHLFAIGLLVPLLTIALLIGNLGSLPYFGSLFVAGELPKGEIIRRAIVEMPDEYPAMPYVGLGAGQFSSRASLIATGLYLGGIDDPKTVPFLKAQVSKSVEDYLYDLWVVSSESGPFGGGSTVRPYFSWISVYTEFGALAFLGICGYVAVLLIRLKRRALSGEQKWQAVSAGSALVLFFLLGFQENYWEVPQAILIGLMFVQVMYANAVYCSDPSGSGV